MATAMPNKTWRPRDCTETVLFLLQEVPHMAIASASQVSSSEHQHGSCHPHKSIQSCMYLPMWSSIHPPQPPTHRLPGGRLLAPMTNCRCHGLLPCSDQDVQAHWQPLQRQRIKDVGCGQRQEGCGDLTATVGPGGTTKRSCYGHR
jgi:hypothetical protein